MTMAKHTYFANFSVNNGSTYSRTPFEFTNKATAAREIRGIVSAMHFRQLCNRSTWQVEDESGKVVAAGALLGRGCWFNFRELLSD